MKAITKSYADYITFKASRPDVIQGYAYYITSYQIGVTYLIDDLLNGLASPLELNRFENDLTQTYLKWRELHQTEAGADLSTLAFLKELRPAIIKKIKMTF